MTAAALESPYREVRATESGQLAAVLQLVRLQLRAADHVRLQELHVKRETYGDIKATSALNSCCQVVK